MAKGAAIGAGTAGLAGGAASKSASAASKPHANNASQNHDEHDHHDRDKERKKVAWQSIVTINCSCTNYRCISDIWRHGIKQS